MSTEIRNLQPAALWNHFADINAIPRASKKEEKIIAYMLSFGKDLGLESFKDNCGNVIIRKQSTPGMENRKPIVLQSHLDMVHQKNAESDFDFEEQGIEMYTDDGWVKARGTTLGADNGIGVSAIMSILASKEIEHPAIEALFTIDEETGMTGAMGLQGGVLTGEILLNLDTEDDTEIDIGCAGGMDVTAHRKYEIETIVPQNFTAYKITVKGLLGGHSGIDIHRGRGNANKILARLLYDQSIENGLRIHTFTGGSLRNAIPRESISEFCVPAGKSAALTQGINKIIADIKREFHSIELNLQIEIESIPCPSSCMTEVSQKEVLQALYAAHNGVFRMSPDIKDLVEASNNVAKVEIKECVAKILCLTRSSVESSKLDVARALKSVFELGGFVVDFSGSYPGWTPNVDSPILRVLTKLYEKMYESKAHIVACHAGLECGILGKNYPAMDMISYGPTIKGAHSPDEKVNIASVEKFWNFTLEILKSIPAKD